VFIEMRKVLKITGLIVCFPILALFVWFTAIGGTAYLYAIYLEDKWVQVDPKTKKELEQYLHLYSLHQIQPSESMWGKEYQLHAGERMMQYRILWHKQCPLDVVYDQGDNIKRIFTSYE
jgi:hypothetical protein